MFKEFKEFAVKGNVVDMGVGIVIGGAFATIVKSFVSDILMPPIGLLMGDVDFSDLFMVLKAGAEKAPPYESLTAAKEAGAVTLNYGLFINSVIAFLIVGWALFMVVKALMKAKKKEEEPSAEPTTKESSECCTEIPIQAKRCPNCTSEQAAA